jgi:hypothetical protein
LCEKFHLAVLLVGKVERLVGVGLGELYGRKQKIYGIGILVGRGEVVFKSL